MQNRYLYSRISCYLMSAIDKMYIPCIFALYIYMLAASALCLGRDGTLVNLWSGLKDYFTSCVLLWMLCGQDLKTFTLCVLLWLLCGQDLKTLLLHMSCYGRLCGQDFRTLLLCVSCYGWLCGQDLKDVYSESSYGCYVPDTG